MHFFQIEKKNDSNNEKVKMEYNLFFEITD